MGAAKKTYLVVYIRFVVNRVAFYVPLLEEPHHFSHRDDGMLHASSANVASLLRGHDSASLAGRSANLRFPDAVRCTTTHSSLDKSGSTVEIFQRFPPRFRLCEILIRVVECKNTKHMQLLLFLSCCIVKQIVEMLCYETSRSFYATNRRNSASWVNVSTVLAGTHPPTSTPYSVTMIL